METSKYSRDWRWISASLTIILLAFVGALLLAARWEASAQRPAAANPGRYQLVTGSYYGTVDGKTTADGNAVFKIDTETGATWIYLVTKDARGLTEGWKPIPNLTRP